MLVLALVVSLVAFVAFAVAPLVAVVIPAAVLIGFGFGTLNPMFPVLIAERVPEAARGRVLGLQNAGYLVGYPIGVLLAGVVVQSGGVQLGVIVTAAIWAAFVAVSACCLAGTSAAGGASSQRDGCAAERFEASLEACTHSRPLVVEDRVHRGAAQRAVGTQAGAAQHPSN